MKLNKNSFNNTIETVETKSDEFDAQIQDKISKLEQEQKTKRKATTRLNQVVPELFKALESERIESNDSSSFYNREKSQWRIQVRGIPHGRSHRLIKERKNNTDRLWEKSRKLEQALKSEIDKEFVAVNVNPYSFEKDEIFNSSKPDSLLIEFVIK